MKIAWFTPFSEKSAIGKYSKIITNELAKTALVDLWIPKSAPLLTSNLSLVLFAEGDDLTKRLAGYDFVVYNLGDHCGYHKEIYEVSRKHRGIVILHDYIMHHFYHYYYLVEKHNPQSYVNDMSFYYGDAGKSVANDVVQGKTIPDWETKIMEYPFFEKAIAGALGVICHSDFLADKIRPRTLAPVAKLHFPVENVSSIRDAKIDKDAWGIPHDKTVLLTMGNVNRNKRIDRIIEILGKQRSLREKVVYIIIGAYDHNPDFHKYTDLIAKYNLDETVRFLGYQPDTVLSSFMSSADIFVNMRFPVMEGGSASLAEQMLYKKPIIVTNAGHYSELPDDCVVKIDVEQEASHLVKALTKLISDKELRLRIGDRAATYVKDHCSVHRYGDEINEFLIQSIQLRPCLRLVDRISDELANMKISRELPVVDIVSQEISIIFS